MNWAAMSLRGKAEFLVDQMDGLSDEDIDEIYAEWAEMEFEQSGMGYDQSLNALWNLAYERSLKNLGRWDAYEEEVGKYSKEK